MKASLWPIYSCSTRPWNNVWHTGVQYEWMNQTRFLPSGKLKMESNPHSRSGANTKPLNVATSNSMFDSESNTELRDNHNKRWLPFSDSSNACALLLWVYLAHVSGSEEEIQRAFPVYSFPHPLCVRAESSPTLWDPMNCSPSGFSVHWVFQAKYWSGVPFPPPGDLLDPGVKPMSLTSPALADRFFTSEPPGNPTILWGEHHHPCLADEVLKTSWVEQMWERMTRRWSHKPFLGAKTLSLNDAFLDLEERKLPASFPWNSVADTKWTTPWPSLFHLCSPMTQALLVSFLFYRWESWVYGGLKVLRAHDGVKSKSRVHSKFTHCRNATSRCQSLFFFSFTVKCRSCYWEGLE